MFAENSIWLGGRLGGDAEIRALENGRRVAMIRLAVDRNVKTPSGKWITETHWFRVVTYAPFLIDLLATEGKKGRPFFVHGALRAREWEQNGERHRLLEIEVDGNGGLMALTDPLAVNSVRLVGRLGDKASIQTFPGEKARKLAAMNVAVGRGYQDASGEWPVDWLRVVTSQPSLIDKTLAKQALKGRLVAIQGELRAREWTDNDTGEVKTSFEVEVENSNGIVPVLERKKEKANA